jgi:hypothetical protein
MRLCVVVVMSGDLCFRDCPSHFLPDTNRIFKFSLTFEAIAAGVLAYVALYLETQFPLREAEHPKPKGFLGRQLA